MPRFQPTGQGDLAPSGAVARVRANIAALRTLRTLQAEERPATGEEQQVLARWSGWGAVPEAFDERDEVDGKPGPGVRFSWAREELHDLLSEEEYAAARRNTLNAHYTDAGIVQALWEGVAELGFSGGRVLEPGCGSGNFIGFAPADAQLVGIELDPVTAGVAAALYPDAQVLNESFVDTRARSGSFDLVIGNVPFGKITLTDRRHNRGEHSIHDHFVIKGLDLVRPGGLVAVVTSRYTMDSVNPAVRREMAEYGTLVGAVRLPTGAHQKAAGTKVVTDILIFRAGPPDSEVEGPKWEQTRGVRLGGSEDIELPVNEYFLDHPEQVIGELGLGGMYRADDLSVDFTGELRPALREAIGRVVRNAADAGLLMTEASETERSAGPVALVAAADQRDEGYIEVRDDETFTQIAGGAVEPYTPAAGQIAELRALLGVRDTAVALLTAEAATLDDTPEIDELRAQLNLRYDDYVTAYGPVNRHSWSARIRSTDQGKALRERLLGEGHARYSGGTFTLPDTDDGRAQAERLVADGHAEIRAGRLRMRTTAAARRVKERLLAEGTATLEGDRTFTLNPSGRAIVEELAGTDPEAVSQVPAFPGQGGFRGDPYAPLVYGLEDFDSADQRATKGAIFSERSVGPRRPRLGADTPQDALAICLDTFGRVPLAEVARLLGCEPHQARERLGTLVFDDPADSERIIPAAEYLSGHVREKLAQAREAAMDDPRFEANVSALTEVIPVDLRPEDIDARLGAPWVGARIVERFLRETLSDPTLRVEHPGGSYWGVKGACDGVLATSTWGTDRYAAPELAQTIMEQRPIRVTDNLGTREQPKRVLNVDATAAAQEKADELKERFSDWCWEDPDRAAELARIYNDTFNGIVLRSYDDSRLSMHGLALTFKPHAHQVAAVARMINEPAVLLAHEVGAGKTAEMAMGVMELRRLGLVRKPAIVVPNHMLEQFQREFMQLYPQAKVLVATKKDMATSKRRAFVGQIATRDLDAVIIAHSSFEKIPMSRQAQRAYLKRELDQFEEMITRVKGDGEEGLTVRRLEAAKQRAEERLKKKMETLKDPGITFEATGIDYLVVDEAHLFKNLRTPSTIPGAAIDGSNRATDLDMKIGYLRERNGARVVTFATATPIANSVTEAYVMQRYERPDLLAKAGMDDFDAWAATFGEVTVGIEFSPDGNGFRQKGRFAKFTNVPEMLKMWHVTADIKTAEDLNLKVPLISERADGQRAAETAVIDPSDEQLLYIAELGERAEAVRNRQVEPEEDNMLKISSDGRKAALDMRLVDPSTEIDVPSKLEVAADRIATIWEDNRDRIYLGVDKQPHPTPGALQLVFCDLGTPGGKGWNAYAELRDQLVERGMPREQIRFIHEARNDREKGELFAAARTGRVSVLIGSTEKMGVGTNVQNRAIALHHLDCPWRPADLQQREGRILRQGNQHERMNVPVEIVRYVTERSFDAYMWQGLTRKARFIGQVMRGRLDVREMEDVGEQSLSFNEVKALATGNPLLMDLAEAETALVRLERRARTHRRNQDMLARTVDSSAQRAENYAGHISEIDAAIDRRRVTSGDAFRMNLRGIPFKARADAGKRLIEMLNDQFSVVQRGVHLKQEVTAGDLGGFSVVTTVERVLTTTEIRIALQGAPEGELRLKPADLRKADPVGLINRLENRLQRFEKVRQETLDTIERMRVEGERAREGLGQPFAQGAELENARRRVADLNRELAELTRESARFEPGPIIAAIRDTGRFPDLVVLADNPELSLLLELPDGRTATLEPVADKDRPIQVRVGDTIAPAALEEVVDVLAVLYGDAADLPDAAIEAIRSRTATVEPAGVPDTSVTADADSSPDRSAAAPAEDLASAEAHATEKPAVDTDPEPKAAVPQPVRWLASGEPTAGASGAERLAVAQRAARNVLGDSWIDQGTYTRQEQVDNGAAVLVAYTAVLSDYLRSGADQVPSDLVTAFEGVRESLNNRDLGWMDSARRFAAVGDVGLGLAYGKGTQRSSVSAQHGRALSELANLHLYSLTPRADRITTDLVRDQAAYTETQQVIDAETAIAAACRALLDGVQDRDLTSAEQSALTAVATAMQETRATGDGGLQGEINRHRILADQAGHLSTGTGPVAVAAYTLWAAARGHEARLRRSASEGIDRSEAVLAEAIAQRGKTRPEQQEVPSSPGNVRALWIEHNSTQTILHIARGVDPEIDKLAKSRALVYAPSKKHYKCNGNWKFATREGRVTDLARTLALAGRPFRLETYPPGADPAANPPQGDAQARAAAALPVGMGQQIRSGPGSPVRPWPTRPASTPGSGTAPGR